MYSKITWKKYNVRVSFQTQQKWKSCTIYRLYMKGKRKENFWQCIKSSDFQCDHSIKWRRKHLRWVEGGGNF